jgi:hypothetical protein
MACQFSSCFNQKTNKNLQKVDDLADTIVERNRCETKGWLGKLFLKVEDRDEKTCFLFFRALLANACIENDELTENLMQSWGCSSNDGLISFDEHFHADGRVALEPHLLELMEKSISKPGDFYEALFHGNNDNDVGWLRKQWFDKEHLCLTGKKYHPLEKKMIRLHICLLFGLKVDPKPLLKKSWGVSDAFLKKELIWFRGSFQSPILRVSKDGLEPESLESGFSA